MYVQEGLKAGLTFMSALSTWITSQLSVENAMANRAAENRENIEAKHKVTALQNAMVIEGGGHYTLFTKDHYKATASNLIHQQHFISSSPFKFKHFLEVVHNYSLDEAAPLNLPPLLSQFLCTELLDILRKGACGVGA